LSIARSNCDGAAAVTERIKRRERTTSLRLSLCISAQVRLDWVAENNGQLTADSGVVVVRPLYLLMKLAINGNAGNFGGQDVRQLRDLQ
jgi:hypothetical protein